MTYQCIATWCPARNMERKVSDLPMDVRYIEAGDIVNCPECDAACEVKEVTE